MACTDADFAYLRSIVLEQSSNTLDGLSTRLISSSLVYIACSTDSGFGTLNRLVAALRQKPDSIIKRCIAEAMNDQ